jgi:hypothetical protein
MPNCISDHFRGDLLLISNSTPVDITRKMGKSSEFTLQCHYYCIFAEASTAPLAIFSQSFFVAPLG